MALLAYRRLWGEPLAVWINLLLRLDELGAVGSQCEDDGDSELFL
ncbi:hypothetical protein AK972_6007 [Pseudomonas yamanorum]|nr:hypothetical protein AK972_6007 [Pseudomonas yamanorum]